jgi:hypothetical protein
MVSASVPRIHGLGNLCHGSPPGVLRLSPAQGAGWRTLFVFRRLVAGAKSRVKSGFTIEEPLHHTGVFTPIRAPPLVSASSNLKITIIDNLCSRTVRNALIFQDHL